MASSDDEDDLFKVETVPPPEGESDVYNAPTKVGQLAGSLVEEIVQHARRQQEQRARAEANPSGASSSRGEEPAVIDPMKLRALEELAAKEGAALRPPPVPSELVAMSEAVPIETPPPPPPPPALPVEPSPRPRQVGAPSAVPVEPSPRPREVDAAPPAPFLAEPAARASSRPVSTPIAAPLTTSPEPEPAPSVPAPRPASRLSTMVILALVALCLAFGIYRLRRSR